MNGSVMFISINPIGKLPRQKKNTAQKLVANGAVLGITVEAENDLRHGGCKERIRERGIERERERERERETERNRDRRTDTQTEREPVNTPG